VTAANALISLAASPTVSPVGGTVVLTATVTSATSGTPTGAVIFYNGTTSLGSANLSGTTGIATLSLTTLPLGADNITAFYGGSVDFYSTTSAAVAVTVVTPEFTITPAAGSSALSILPGGTATFTFTVTPQSPETVYGAAITLSVSGLPPNATSTITPATMAAGALPQNAQLVVSVPNPSLAQGAATRGIRSQLASGLAALLLLPFAVPRRRTRTWLRNALRSCLLVSLAGAALAGTIGCGSAAAGIFVQTPQAYTLTVTGTSTKFTQSTNVTLTIQ